MSIFFDEIGRRAFLEFLRNHTPLVLFLSTAIAVLKLTDWQHEDIATRIQNGFFVAAWLVTCAAGYVVNVWQFANQTMSGSPRSWKVMRAALILGVVDGVAFAGVVVAAALSVAKLHRG